MDIKKLIFILTIDGIIFIFCGLGIVHNAAKVDLPFKFKATNSYIIITSVSDKSSIVQAGDTITAIDGRQFTSREEIEVYFDGVKVNQTIKIDYIKSGIENEINIKPVRFYTAFYLTVVSVTCILFFIIGIFVLLKKPDVKASIVFHHVVISTAVIMSTTWGNYTFGPQGIGYILRFLFSVSYTLAPAAFLHFTLIFPREKKFNSKIIYALYLIAAVIGIISFLYFLQAAEYRTLQSIQSYLLLFEICRILIVSCIIAGMIIFIHSYLTAKEIPEKKKLRWVMYGLIIGPLMFALLWVIPQAITSYGLIPEEFIVILMLAIPITFAIAILKYHLLDINLIIKRSIIYAVVIGGLLVIYISLIFAATSVLKDISQYSIGSITAIIIALLFQPAKTKVQRIVDRKFFRVEYNFRDALRQFLNDIKNASSKEELARSIIKKSDSLLQTQKTGFFIFDPARSRISLIAHSNFELLMGRSVYLNQEGLKTNLNLPVALSGKVESSVVVEIADNRVFRRWGIALVLPIKSVNGNIIGFLVMGEKKSGIKFTAEDIDLLQEIAMQAGLVLERISIQEELLREQITKEKLEELNKLKSFFISTVSHELKTPLTSIKLFSEMMQENENLNKPESKEYLEIISGECDRLSRLIENVLDLSKIERGVKEYHFTEIDIKSLLYKALELMAYQFKMEKCKVEYMICKEECTIYADSDAVMSAVINLLSNGIKYSAEPKKLNITIEISEDNVLLGFKNNGPQLTQDEICYLTEPYYRSNEVRRKNIPGSGIGLALVNQIMEAHQGKLEIKNCPEHGCLFMLKFPLEKENEANYSY